MAAPPFLDVEALLAPIPGDDPSGVPVPLEVHFELDRLREEQDPDDYDEDDPLRPETFQRADWPAFIRLATETLTQKSKDLQLAARLTEALVRQHAPDGHGFAGLRDGLRLLRDLVEQCWDRVRPAPEEGEPDRRGEPFRWLGDPLHGVRLPNRLRTLPLVFGKELSFGWKDWQDAHSPKAKDPARREALEKAVRDAQVGQCEETTEEIRQAVEELNLLGARLRDRLQGEAPTLDDLRQALTQCLDLSERFLAQKRPKTEAKTDGTGRDGGNGVPEAAVPRGPLTTRAEIYRQLAQAAAALRHLEPHSPIPYMIERAVQLGDLPFPQLIRAMIRDANVLAELSRELGLGEAAAPPTADMSE